jgi:hypothetical protein
VTEKQPLGKKISFILTARSRAFHLLSLIFVFIFSGQVFAQNKVDLEDLSIKGELINDERMHLTSRDAQQMAEKITYRTNFRKEIIDSREVKWPTDTLASPADGLPTPRQPAAFTKAARP